MLATVSMRRWRWLQLWRLRWLCLPSISVHLSSVQLLQLLSTSSSCVPITTSLPDCRSSSR
ncbi:unnamed protein product [Cylicostephanus goldi]|uniref:Uncharacterized protein n=1 Tax=Cylicostephanus goldi TaxID=71465 RepID=A0A3P6R519_CYLGO|nr:unnamed protein product [Cylicostephanus goldi]